MVYTADADPLCYVGTTVLRNRLGLQDQADLDEYELAVFITRSEEPWPAGDFDFAHYKSLHRHLFQDVYDWAGEVRTIRIGKGGNWFCYPEYVNAEMERIFGDLKSKNLLVGMDRQTFATEAAHVLAELNAVHPFREGNGRTQLAFLAMLAEHADLMCDLAALDQRKIMDAMIESFSGSEEPLAKLIVQIITILNP